MAVTSAYRYSFRFLDPRLAGLCERQLEGIAKAKAAGVYKGRPPS
jgi:hypothetical protein